MSDQRMLPRDGTVARLMAELVVIVVGVLLALAAENAWADLQDRRYEEAALESLMTDLDAAQLQLNEYVRRDSTIIRHADVILAQTSLRADSVALHVSRIFNTIPDQVRLPTLDELIGTGRLSLFRDRNLRLALLDFDAKARTLAGYTSQVEAQWNEIARPVLYRSLNWDDIASQFPRIFGEPTAAEVLSDPSEQIVLTSELRATIRDRRAFAAVHVERVDDVVESLDQLREVVANQTGGP